VRLAFVVGLHVANAVALSAPWAWPSSTSRALFAKPVAAAGLLVCNGAILGLGEWRRKSTVSMSPLASRSVTRSQVRAEPPQ